MKYNYHNLNQVKGKITMGEGTENLEGYGQYVCKRAVKIN